MANDLMGKLRALEERIDSAEYVEERMFDFADLADLLPAIIAEIERLTAPADPAEPYQAPDDNDWSPCEIYV